MFQTNNQDITHSNNKTLQMSQPYRYNNNYEFRTLSNSTTENTEILFDFFPSIFMPYLDVDTFCNLLKTDLWHWQYLLSDRIIYDYCHYISLKYKSEIEKFCDKPFNDKLEEKEEEEDVDDDDDDDDDDEVIHDSAFEEDRNNFFFNNNHDFEKIKNIKDEEQNFAIIRIKSNENNQDINDCDGVFNYFKKIDIISDRMLLTESHDIGLSTNLCKTIIIDDNNNNNNVNILNQIYHKNDIILSFKSFDGLRTTLISQNFFNDKDMKYIQDILLMDVLSKCPINKWYFLQSNQIKNQYFDQFPIIQIKQMIVAHFDDNKFRQNKNNKNEQLFICWSIEWQQIDIDDDESDDNETSISSSN